MGLDSVDLVMAFEEEFGVSISDSAAEKMQTPRHVIDFVQAKRLDLKSLDIASHVGRVLAQMGYGNVSVAEEISFDDLFQKRGRIREWTKFCSKLAPFAAPPARRSGPGCGISACGFLGAVAGVYFHELWLLLSGLCSFAGGHLVSRRTMKIPEATATLPKLIKHLNRPVSRDEVALAVKRIVVEQLSLAETAYGEDKSFIKDFGMN